MASYRSAALVLVALASATTADAQSPQRVAATPDRLAAILAERKAEPGQ